jgi:ERCC4-type nuclease
MDAFDVEDVMKTFSVIVDTREQDTPKAADRYRAFGVPYERATLYYGDYCAQVVLPDGDKLHDTSRTIRAACAVERKMSLDELAMCFTRERSRFKREFERAAECGAKVYLLVENATWEGIIGHRYRSRFRPEAFIASLTAWMVRYNMTPVFCKADSSGRVIKEILYRDMKERMEKRCENS